MVAKMSGAPAPVRSDDFCNSGSGWPVGDRATYSLHYLAGPPCVYQIRITEDNNLAAATPGWQASNFTLESLVRLDTVNPGGAGLLFGVSSDWTRFSVFGIGNNGKYWLSTYQQGGWTRVVPSTVTDKINLNGENRLRVVSDGTRFAIYLNDYGLANVDDGASHAGRMGLYAEGLAGFDARFRAVKLWNDSITPADEAGPAGEWQGAGALMD